MKKLIGILTSLLLILSIVNCGGGGGSSSTSGSSSVSTSQFVDSPVQGLYYLASPSGQTGSTDASGNFNFKTGDTVSFKIGGKDGLEIASTSPVEDTPIFVADLPGGLQVAQILQSLDLGGDATTKLDLSQITSLPSATKTSLENHFKNGGSLSAGEALMTSIRTDIKGHIPALASKNFPTLPTASVINQHLKDSIAKLPSKLPALDGKVFVVLKFKSASDTDKQFSLIGFKDGKVKSLTNQGGTATGIYSQTATNLSMSFDSYKQAGQSTSQKISCGISTTFKSFDDKIPGAFAVNGKYSGSDCPSTEEYIFSFVSIDQNVALDTFKGNNYVLTKNTDIDPNGIGCDVLSWGFSNEQNVKITYTTTSQSYLCTSGLIFNEQVQTFSSDVPFIFKIQRDYGLDANSNSLGAAFLFMKLSGIEKTYAVLWASNFTPSETVGQIPTADSLMIRRGFPVIFTKQ